MRVVQIEPGPMPTFIASAPASIRSFTAAGFAIFPTTTSIFSSFLIAFSVSIMPFVCPWAESMTSASTPASTKAFALSNPPTPIAAATLSLPSSSLFAFGYSFFFFRSFIVIRPTSLLLSSTMGSFSTLFPAKILAASSSVQPFGAVISGIFVITSPTFLSKAFSKRKSRFVRIPSKVLFSSTTGTPEM